MGTYIQFKIFDAEARAIIYGTYSGGLRVSSDSIHMFSLTLLLYRCIGQSHHLWSRPMVGNFRGFIRFYPYLFLSSSSVCNFSYSFSIFLLSLYKCNHQNMIICTIASSIRPPRFLNVSFIHQVAAMLNFLSATEILFSYSFLPSLLVKQRKQENYVESLHGEELFDESLQLCKRTSRLIDANCDKFCKQKVSV